MEVAPIVVQNLVRVKSQKVVARKVQAGGGSGGESGSGSSSNQSEQSSKGSSSGDSEGQEDNKKFGLEHSGVLVTDSEIDWTSIKSDVETLYSSIPNVTLDLYQLHSNQEDILNFNKEYDNLTVNVKDEKKEETLSSLSKLYEYMPRFAQNSSDDELEKSLIEIKNDVLKAYSKVDLEKWDEIQNDISNAINNYSKLMTNANIESKKPYNVNKGFVMLNELKNAAGIKDKEVFFIKYKNLLEEMNNM